MQIRSNFLPSAAAGLAILLAIGLTACQSDPMLRRNFPPEQRISLESGGPYQVTAETMSVILGYHYRVEADTPQGRIIQIDGSLKRFKIRVSSVSLYLSFLDAQGEIIRQQMVLALSNREARATFIRASRIFATELALPEDSVYFAFHSRSTPARGSR